MAERIENPDLELMRRFDGDASTDGALDESEQATLDGLAELSAMVREGLHAELEDALDGDPMNGMWARIEHAISTNGVAKSALAEDSHAAEPKVAEEQGLFAALSAWFDRYRGHLATGAVAAAAAAALVWFVRPPDKTVEYVEVPIATNPAVVPVALESQPAEIESLEVYDGSGIVLTIPSGGDDDSSTTVIWLTPPENSVEGPI